MIFFSRNVTEDGQRPRRRVGCLGGCLIFFAVYFICSAILGWLMGDALSSSSVDLKDQTVYRLQLKGTLVEQGQEESEKVTGALRKARKETDAAYDAILAASRLP